MKTSISGKNITKEMKSLARDGFAEHGNPSCICVGVANIGQASSSRRQKDGGLRAAYVAASGATGRTVLRDALNDAGVDGGNWTGAMVTGALTTMATTLATYGSKKKGSTAIVQAQNWTTHNCAESNLALFLYKSGVNLSRITIASYEINEQSVSYKALCNNCQQWCRLHFNVLADFDSHT